MAAADALSGRNVWLGIGKQSAVNAAAAPSEFFEVTELGGVLEEYDWKKSDRRVGTRFKALGYKSGKKVPLSFAVEVNAQNAGLLLTLGLGADAAGAAGAAYEHTISLAENLPYFTAVICTDLVADTDAGDTLHQIVNCKVISLKLDGGVDDVLKLSIEAVGTKRNMAYASKSGISGTLASGSPNVTVASTAGLIPGQKVTGMGIPASTTILSITSATAFVLSANATATGAQNLAFSLTPTFPTARSLYMKAEEGQAKIELGADIGSLAQFDEATEFHFSLSNGVAPDKRIDNSAEAYGLREGDSEITGSMKATYNRNALVEVEAFQAGTPRALRFTATSVELAAVGQPFKLTLIADKARYSGAPPAWDPDVISADLQYEVERSSSYPVIEIINTKAQAY